MTRRRLWLARPRYVTNAITSPLLPSFLFILPERTIPCMHSRLTGRAYYLRTRRATRSAICATCCCCCCRRWCVHPTISNGDSATAHTLRQGKQMNGVVQVAMACCDSASKAKYIFTYSYKRSRRRTDAGVACRRYLSTLHRCKCCKTRQNPKQEAVSGEANGRATRRRCQTLAAAAEITAQTPTSSSPPSSFSLFLYLNKVWLNSI